jgi:type II secretory pathway pseudopilin PulG
MTPSFTNRRVTKGRATKLRPGPSEEGYILVAVIFMLAILILSMAVAIPRVRDDIKRDREIETMQRGKQYIRAVQLYFKKFHSYPPNVDSLVKTNNIRFLRKKYVDPTTGKDEWKPVLFGQNKTPQAMGFFGQPLGGAALAGTGPSGGKGIPGSPGSGGTPSAGGGLFSTGSSSTDSGASSSTSSGASGTSAIGGAGIIGFSPQSPKQSILVYKKKNHYNEWEFLYSPLMDQQTGITGTTGQQPPQPAPQPSPQPMPQ